MRTSYQVICDQLDEVFQPSSKRRQRKSKWQLDKEVDRGRFEAYREISKAMGESNDCTVRAVAACCGVTYQVAHEACAKQGRQKGKGLWLPRMFDAIRSLGFKVERMHVSEEVELLGVLKNYHVKNLTTRQVAMFAEHFGKTRRWDSYDGVILSTAGHVAAYSKGAVHDFGASRALRVDSIYRVVKA